MLIYYFLKQNHLHRTLSSQHIAFFCLCQMLNIYESVPQGLSTKDSYLQVQISRHDKTNNESATCRRGRGEVGLSPADHCLTTSVLASHNCRRRQALPLTVITFRAGLDITAARLLIKKQLSVCSGLSSAKPFMQ